MQRKVPRPFDIQKINYETMNFLIEISLEDQWEYIKNSTLIRLYANGSRDQNRGSGIAAIVLRFVKIVSPIPHHSTYTFQHYYSQI